MRPTPAATGTNARKTGRNLAMMIALPPCFSKNAVVRSTFSGLKNRLRSRRNTAGPAFLPMR